MQISIMYIPWPLEGEIRNKRANDMICTMTLPVLQSKMGVAVKKDIGAIPYVADIPLME